MHIHRLYTYHEFLRAVDINSLKAGTSKIFPEEFFNVTVKYLQLWNTSASGILKNDSDLFSWILYSHINLNVKEILCGTVIIPPWKGVWKRIMLEVIILSAEVEWKGRKINSVGFRI